MERAELELRKRAAEGDTLAEKVADLLHTAREIYGKDVPLIDNNFPSPMPPGEHALLIEKERPDAPLLFYTSEELQQFENQQAEMVAKIDARIQPYINHFREHIPQNPNVLQRVYPVAKWKETDSSLTMEYNYTLTYDPISRDIRSVEVSMTSSRDIQDKEEKTFSPILFMQFEPHNQVKEMGIKWQIAQAAVWNKAGFQESPAKYLIDKTIFLLYSPPEIAQVLFDFKPKRENDQLPYKPTLQLVRYYRFYGAPVINLRGQWGKIQGEYTYQYDSKDNAFKLLPNPTLLIYNNVTAKPDLAIPATSLPDIISSFFHLLPLADPFASEK